MNNALDIALITILWPIRLWSCLTYFLFYLFCRCVIQFATFFSLDGYKRADVGTCTIVAPPKQIKIILEGIEFLRTIDPSIFRRLTAEHRYIFVYVSKPVARFQCRDIFSIDDACLSWGKEGICICLVQSILAFNLMYLPVESSLVVGNRGREAFEARREIQQQLLKWMAGHSFSPVLVKHYEELAKAAEMP
jgi:hypothetical protein